MISDNGMGAAGAKALSPALGHLTQLTKLSLRGEYTNVCVKAGFGSVRVCMMFVYIFVCWSVRD